MGKLHQSRKHERVDSPMMFAPPPRRSRVTRRPFFWLACLGLLLLALSMWSDVFSIPQVHAAAATHASVLKGSPSKPNRMNPTSGSTSNTRLYQPGAPGSASPGTPQTIMHGFHTPMPMKAGSVDLQVNQAARFVGSDQRLELLIPAGAITTQDLAQAGGKITLRVTQIAPASGSNAGGSGHISFGTYMIQLLDAHGALLTHGLSQPITAKYHVHTNELEGLGLDHAYALLNGTVSASETSIQGIVQPAAGKTLASTIGARQTQPSRLDTKAQTLTATPQISTPSSSLSWNSDAPIASFGKPDPFSTDLRAGGLTSSQSIAVPDGPGGLTPSVNLSYSSQSVNGQHSYSAAADWVGEGWDLSLGEITWSQHNVFAGCTPQPSCGTNWENVWYLNDPYGTSSQLIPPNITVSTFYDATTNTYCEQSNPTYNCPILWHTATETHDKIYAYVGNVNIGQSIYPPCFRVWRPNGIMEEFGCTSDSIQYFYGPGANGHSEVSGWYLDMITDPQGNQIHLTYQRDMAKWTDPSTNTVYSYPRDVVLQSIQYDSPGCLNAQTMCTGSAWAPQMQVVFNAGHTPTTLTNATTGCNTGSNLRCDDPLDLSGSGGTAAPLIESTYVLNNIQVQVRTSGTGTWNTLRTYNLGYEQSGPTTITDPASSMQASSAGMLDLTQIQQVGSTGANALLYSGKDNSATASYAYMKVFDLSSKNIVVGSNTSLSYWIYPQSSATSSSVSGSNSTCVAIDLIFTDGTALRNLGAVDQHGNQLHPAHQCGHLNLDQWNQVISDIGAVAKGKTISKLDEGYDQPANTGGYRGYIDDISLSNPTSNSPLFATGFESGDPSPTWTNTVDTGPEAQAGNIYNVGGICCSLTGPEAGTRSEVVHTDTAALPQVTYTYTTQTNYYVDSYFKPNPSTNCGPSWNTGNGSGCLLWEKSYANNSRFLSSVSNGQGLAQSFSWMLARNNSHGVTGGGTNTADPFYCDSHQTGYPCNEADDGGWSLVALSQESNTTTRLTQNGQGGQQTSTPVTETTGYSYQLTYPLPAQQCSDCVAGMYWGNQNDDDYLNYYNGTFMGFAQTTVTAPSGAVEVHKFYAGEGWGTYDPKQVTCVTPSPCHAAPWWHLANAGHGQEYQVLAYDTDGKTLLKEVDSSYQAVCPPTGVPGTPASSQYGTWNGNLVSELDHNNPVAVCDIQPTQQVSKTFAGGSTSSNTTASWIYDSYGRVTQETTTANGGTPAAVVHNTSYVWNDTVTATKTSATGTYIIDTPAFSDTEDGAGNRLRCSYLSYDGQGYTTGQTGTLTGGLQTTEDAYADCGTSANGYTLSGKSTTTTVYNTHGDAIASSDPDHNAGIAGHTGCTVNSAQYTNCTAYDSTYAVFTTSASNALNQTSSTSYANTGNVFGFGTWPVSTTNVNKQTTSYTYDALGRMTGETLPGETAGKFTRQWVYTDWCSGTAAQSPCVEVDEIDRLDSSTTVTTRAFYDGEGRLVETRAPGPAGQDVVTYSYYDSAGRPFFKSNPYFVTAYTGMPGSAAYSIPDSTQPGTSMAYPTLRQTSVTDPNSHTTTTTASVVCGVSGTSDSGCYAQTMALDANGHESATLSGGLGQTNYQQRYTGTSTYTLYSTTKKTYDAAGELLSTVAPDGSTTATFVYDALGRKTSEKDPDSGATTATYDPNGNLLESVDARGSAGTIFAGYDGLNRPLWRNSTNSSSGAWVTYTYDSTANGNQGVGELTGETFSGSGGLSGAYAYTYDARGQQVGETVTVNGANYPVQATYNDNGQLLSQTYPTGEVVTRNLSSTGWLSGLTTSLNSVTTTLANNLTYTGLAGAAGKVTALNLGNGTYSYAASFDTGMRLTSASLTNTSSSTQLYQTQPAYDAVNNVVSVQTSVSGQTDSQQFCYDDLYRLTWAGTNGTPPCSGTAITAGTLTAAQYQQSNSYDVDGRLTGGPGGSYTYGDNSHPHAMTSTSNGYSAAYDAAGDMTCRALTTATTCSGTPTGQQLSYDAEGRLSSWQNQPASPAQTANYLYDGSGKRVAMQSTVNGTTTLTAYIGSIEEVQTTANTTQTTTYYTVGGERIAAVVNGTFYYFGYDALGSQVVVLNSSGNVIGTQLYGPYGSSRYSTGILPTSIGFTGQLTESVTGLDYYIARYYDPAVGMFLTADAVQGNAQGMNPYAYVNGNPETYNDPTGQYFSPAFLLANGLDGTPLAGRVPGSSGTTTVISTHHFSPSFLLDNGLDGTPLAGRAPSGGWGHPVGGRASGAVHRSVVHRSVPRVRSNRSQGCNDRCHNDKRNIKAYITQQRLAADTVTTLIGDVTSGLADIASAVVDAIGSAWGAFALDSASALVRVASVLADLKVLGIVSLPSWFGSAVGIFKQVVNVVDSFRGLLDLFNPTAFLGKLLESFVSSIGWARITSGVLDFVSGSLSPGVVAIVQNGMDLAKYNNELGAVDNYTPQQALNICKQDYASDPGAC